MKNTEILDSLKHKNGAFVLAGYTFSMKEAFEFVLNNDSREVVNLCECLFSHELLENLENKLVAIPERLNILSLEDLSQLTDSLNIIADKNIILATANLSNNLCKTIVDNFELIEIEPSQKDRLISLCLDISQSKIPTGNLFLPNTKEWLLGRINFLISSFSEEEIEEENSYEEFYNLFIKLTK